MLNETELKMLTKIGFMVAGAIFILTGVYYLKPADYSTSSMQICLGIAFFCVGLAQN